MAVHAAVGSNVFDRVKHAKIILLLGCLCLLSAVCTAQTTQRSLLLVASEQFQLDSIGHSELRKIFLGVPVFREDVRLRPLLNETDPLAMSIFLQKVVFMSEREYKRQLFSRVFRLGDQRPREYGDMDLLVEELRNTHGSLTYMWSDQLESYTGLKSLGIIWTGSDD